MTIAVRGPTSTTISTRDRSNQSLLLGLSTLCLIYSLSRVTRLTGWRCTQAPLCFVFFCGYGFCMTVLLVQLLHDVWNFNSVSPLGPSTRQNAASLHSLFCKAFCFGMSVSAIQFRCTQALLCFVFFCGCGLCVNSQCIEL